MKPSKPASPDSSLLASLPAVISIILWCFSGVCFRKGSELLGPMPYLMFMTGGGAAFALLIHAVRGKSVVEVLRLPVRVVASGFFGVAVYTVLLALAFGTAQPRDLGLINLLNYLWPVWIVLLSILFLGDVPRRMPLIAGVAAGFLGLMVSRGPGWLQWPSGSLLPHLMSLSGAFMWAVYSVLLRRWRISEEQGGTTVHFFFCALIAGVLLLIRGEWPEKFTMESILWIIFGAAGPVGSAYYFWEIGIKRGSVSLIASLSYFIPIGSSVAIGLIFSEAMNVGLIPGAVLIALGAWLVRRGASRRLAP